MVLSESTLPTQKSAGPSVCIFRALYNQVPGYLYSLSFSCSLILAGSTDHCAIILPHMESVVYTLL